MQKPEPRSPLPGGWSPPFNCQLRVNLWDLSGCGDYLEVRNEFYKDAQGCLLVYDATNRQSFESLQRWVDEAQAFGAKDMVVFVAANKADAAAGPGRKVPEREGKDWALSQGFFFFEVSASSGQNVRSLFVSLFARMLATIPGIPQELAAAAVQQANAVREEDTAGES